jgi:hypothetical protein
LEAVVGETWEDLSGYWGARGFAPPSREWLLAELWSMPGMRGVVCQDRLRRDLVDAYARPREAA